MTPQEKLIADLSQAAELLNGVAKVMHPVCDNRAMTDDQVQIAFDAIGEVQGALWKMEQFFDDEINREPI